jgi:hypothetical protein
MDRIEDRNELIRSLTVFLKDAKYITFIFPGDASEYISVYGPSHLLDKVPASWGGYDVMFFEEIVS